MILHQNTAEHQGILIVIGPHQRIIGHNIPISKAHGPWAQVAHGVGPRAPRALAKAMGPGLGGAPKNEFFFCLVQGPRRVIYQYSIPPEICCSGSLPIFDLGPRETQSSEFENAGPTLTTSGFGLLQVDAPGA